MNTTPRVHREDVDRLRRLFARDNCVLGLTIDARYRVLRRIGQGGMGDVFTAHDLRLDRPVAMKVLSGPAPRPEWLETFRAEAKIMGSLEHPGIVPVYDLSTLPDGRVYFTMKYVEGQTLEQRIRSGTERRTLIALLADACLTVHHAHEAGVLHRDLKPANLMVDGADRVFVMDWGIARSREGSAGTLCYMAPEQARGLARRIDRRTDVFGLGAILYEILSGKPPIQGRTEEERRSAARAGRIAPLPSTNRDLAAICRTALHPDPTSRYATALELHEDLVRYLERRPVTSRSLGLLGRACKLLRRHPRGSVLALALAGLLFSTSFLFGRTGYLDRRILEEMRETSKASLDAALRLRRAGDLDGMKAQSRALEAACVKVLRAYPRLAEPHVLLARLYRAQIRTRKAQDHLERALRLDPQHPDARFERGLIRWLNYRIELRDCRSGGIPAVPGDRYASPVEPLPETEAMQRAKQAILEDLAGLAPLLAQGIVASVRGDSESADALFQEAIADDEAVWWARAEIRSENGDLDGAVAVLDEGLRRDRGYWPFAATRARLLMLRFGSTSDPTRWADWLRSAVESVEEAIRLGADPSLYFTRGVVRFNFALYGGFSEEEQLRRCTEAMADLERDNVRRPPALETYRWTTRASGHYHLGQLRQRLQGDAGEDYRRSLAAGVEALTLHPDNGRAWEVRGGAEYQLAALKESAGDATCEEDYRRAIASLDRAIVLRPRSPFLPFLRARARQALWTTSRLPESAMGEILSDYDQAARLNPQDAESWKARAFLHAERMKRLLRKKADISAAIAEARAAADESLKRDASQACVWRLQASLSMNWGRIQAAEGRDGTPWFQEAIRSADRSMQLGPRNAESLLGRVWALSLWIQALKAADEDTDRVAALIDEFGRDTDELVKLAPQQAPARALRATYFQWVEGWAEAIRELEELIRLDPCRATVFQRELDACRARLGR